MMTITIDCRMLEASGIGVYLRECLPCFFSSPHRFLLLGDGEVLRHYGDAYKNVEYADCKVKPFSIAELLFFPRALLRRINTADCYYTPFFNIPGGVTVPVYTTIHDIIFPDMPDLSSPLGLFIRMRFFKRAAKKSTKLFTVSQFSKSRIEHHLGTAKPVVVTHSAIRPMFLAYRFREATKKETIVFIGNIKKHKGLDYLLEAFTQAHAEGLPHKLIIIGSRDNFRTADTAVLRKIDALGPEMVSFTGFLSDEELVEHMAAAALLVQPSLYEGFGLPPLEAMVLGTPALISDIPVFREIYGEFPVGYFRAADAGDLKNKLMERLFNTRPACFTLPDTLVSKYTFEKTAAVILRELTGVAGYTHKA